MKFSIIIPTFNSQKIIHRAIESIMSQTYQDWEILLIDGASKDETVHIAESFIDSRIRIYSEQDKGIYDAMNKGIDKATGDWLYFLGSDDYLFKQETLANMALYLEDQFDVVYGDVYSDLPDVYKGEWHLETLQANRCHQCIFYRRSFFGDSLRYNLRYQFLADYDMNLRWFLGRTYHSKYVPIIIAYYSTNGVSSNIENTKNDLLWQDIGLNLLRYGWRALPPLYKKRAARLWANHTKSHLQYVVAKMIWLVYFVISKVVKE